MPKLRVTRENVRAVADALARERGSFASVTAADVKMRIKDEGGRVERFLQEWRGDKTDEVPPEIIEAAVRAVRDAWKQRRGDDAPPPEAASDSRARKAGGADGRRGPGRPARTAKQAPLRKRESFLDMFEAERGVRSASAHARPKHAGPYVRKKYTYKPKSTKREERRPAAVKLYKSLAGKGPPAALPRKRVLKSDWEGAVNPKFAREVAKLLRDTGYALNMSEIYRHLAKRFGWAGGRPDYLVPGVLEGSRIIRYGRATHWFDYEDPPYRSAKSYYVPVESGVAVVDRLAKLFWEAVLEVLKTAGRSMGVREIGDKLGDARLHFHHDWLRQRLKRAAADPSSNVVKAVVGYAWVDKKPTARRQRR